MADKLKLVLTIDTSKLDASIKDIQSRLSGINGEVELDVSTGAAEGEIDNLGNAADETADQVDGIPDEVPTKATGMESFAKLAAGITAAVVALRKLYQAGAAYVGASNVQEEAETSLAASLRATGIEVDSLLPQLKSYASAIQGVTRYGDEAILSGTALMQNIAALSKDELPAAQKAAVGLAARYKIDLKTAFELVGRAAKGQTSTLTRYGMVLDTTKTKEEQFTQLLELGAEGFEIAKDEADDGAGSLEQYQNRIGDLQESMGDLIKVALVPLAKIAGEVAQGFTGFFKSIAETSLERTIRELREMGAATESIMRLEKIQWKNDLTDINKELEKAGIQYKDINEITTLVEENETRKLGLLDKISQLQGDISDKSTEGSLAERAAFGAMMGGYTSKKAQIEQLQYEIDDLDKVNNKYIDNIDLIQKAEVLQARLNNTILEGNDDDGTIIPVNQEDMEAAEAKMAAFWASLRNEREVLEAEFADKKGLIATAYGDTDEAKAEMEKLNIWYAGEQAKLREKELSASELQRQLEITKTQEAYETQIRLLMAKKAVGLNVMDELKAAQTAYAEWIKATYGAESEAYMIALAQMKEANLRWGDSLRETWLKNHEMMKGWIDSIGSSWKSFWGDLIKDGMTINEAMSNLFNNMLNNFINTLVEMSANYIKQKLVELAMGESVEKGKQAAVIGTGVVQSAVTGATLAEDLAAAAASAAAWLKVLAIKVYTFFASMGPLGAVAAAGVLAGIIAAIKAVTSGFADGVIGYRGAGTGTSDSNLVRISDGESIITAEGTRRNPGILAAINRGLTVPMAVPAYAGGYLPGGSGAGDTGLNRKIYNQLVLLTKETARKTFKGSFELTDGRQPGAKYKANLKDQDRYDKRNL